MRSGKKVCVIIQYMSAYCMYAHRWQRSTQQRELISLLLQPHLQQALDRPTTTSRPFRSAFRRASRISSVMKERAILLKTSSLLLFDKNSGCLFLLRRLSITELWLKPSEDSSWWELNGSSSETSAVLLSDRFHREPPQVKMTARMNSRPQSFTPYDGSSMGWTPATNRHTASTTAFHIVPQGNKAREKMKTACMAREDR